MYPVSFIENKPIDFSRVQQLLATSKKQNWFSNFGPVSKALEPLLLNSVGAASESNLGAMFCSSGTTALNAAAGSLCCKRKKELRWVVSANGFYSTRIGQFSNSIVVDCDSRGLLDLRETSRIADSDYDGIIYTNLFGYYDDFEDVFSFCRKHGKALIIDNAASLGSMTQQYSSSTTSDVEWIEVISFHQTKPWGLGEGGAAVFPNELREDFHTMLNFGIDLPASRKVHAGNGKISEFACALIYTRLETMATWSINYHNQASRIINLALEVGLQPITREVPVCSVPGHVPLISSRPNSFADLDNSLLVLQKYYRPLDLRCKKAVKRYAHSFSVPCHNGVATIDDPSLTRLLSRYT